MKPTSKKIRTAIVGYGAVAPFYFRAIKKNKALDLILVCDIDDIKLPSGVKKIDNYKDMSEYDIDLVFICTPPYTHLDLISYFSAKGINVVIEKPMVISNNELDKVKKLNQKYKSYIIPVYHSSYNPLVNHAKKIISKNKIFKVEANCIENALSFHPKSLNWLFDKKKSGGGVIIDSVINTISVLDLFLDNLRIVFCNTENFCGNVESKVNIKFEFKTGFGSIKSDWLSKKSRRREEIVFYLNNGKTLIIDYVGMNLRDGDGNIYYQADKKYNDMDYEYDLLVKDVIDTLSKNKNLVFLEERIKPLGIIFSCYDDFRNNTFQNLTDLSQAEIIKAFSFYVNHKKFPSGFNTHRINFIGDDGLRYFRLLGKNKNYFVKIYKNKKDIFLKELKNYTYFYKNLKLNIPARYFTYGIDEYDLIIYDYISDSTLYDFISSSLKKNFNVSDKIIKKSINQVVNLLVSEVQADYQASEWTKFCPLDFFNIKFVSKKSKSNFLSAYDAVLDIVALANKNNQIYYTDRNPRNMMVKENDIFQIDFEVIENISSLFDLIKLLRNGYDCNKFDIPKMASLSSLNEFLEIKRAFNLKEESFYIKYFFRKIGLSAEDFSFQRILYDILSLHTHLFYVGIYSERIRRIDYLSVKVLSNRLKYHYYESIFLLNKFKDFETHKSFTPHFLVNPSDFKKIIRNVDTQALIHGLNELII